MRCRFGQSFENMFTPSWDAGFWISG